MIARNVQLIDPARTVLAIGRVVDEGDHFEGTIDLFLTPASLRELFDEFEEIVNEQSLSFLDEIQEKIGANRIKAIFEDGSEIDIKDLQVYPTTGDVSFQRAVVLAKATSLAGS